MQKLSICVGQEQQVGGQGGWGGTWKFSKLGPTHTWLSVGGGGCTYVQLGGRGRSQGGVSEHETKICVRQGKAVGGLGGSQGGGA